MDLTVEMWGISIRSGRAKLGCCRRRHIHRAFHFLVDSTSSFWHLFGNELGTKTVYREDLEVQVPLPLRAHRVAHLVFSAFSKLWLLDQLRISAAVKLRTAANASDFEVTSCAPASLDILMMVGGWNVPPGQVELQLIKGK